MVFPYEEMMTSTQQLVERVFSQPTAPFREGWVLHEISKILTEHKIPFFHDSHGNLIAGCKTPRQIGARLILQAHTDHPGFHIVKKLSANRWSAMWFGGAPFKSMVGAKIRVFDPTQHGWSVQAQIVEIEQENYTREGMEMVIELSEPASLNNKCFGAFDFPGCDIANGLITTRAADDLAGVVIALGALIDQKQKGKLRSALAIFTRAEEVGFVGCLKLLGSRVLPKGSWTLTLEASKALPLAERGQGPVLRIGDRSTVFNSDFSIWMWKVAEELKKADNQFLYQRRLMDGGSCEATAMALHGMVTSGISVPLINYHNQGEEGPAPEMIALADVEMGRRFCAELFARFAKRPLNNNVLRKTLNQNCQKLTPQLKQKIQFAQWDR